MSRQRTWAASWEVAPRTSWQFRSPSRTRKASWNSPDTRDRTAWTSPWSSGEKICTWNVHYGPLVMDKADRSISYVRIWRFQTTPKNHIPRSFILILILPWYFRIILILPWYWCLSSKNSLVVFFKWAIPGLFFFIFVFFNTQLTVYKCSILINFCQWLDSNRGPLVLEATALPTEPQPLPKIA